MKLRGIMGAAIAAMFLILGAEGCTSSTNATEKTRCTPGAYVFCRCQDRAEGSKLCNADGSGFEECSTGGGECVGGEDLTDEREGEPVDPPEQKPPEEAGPPGSPVEACPGKPTSIGPGPDTVIKGDTTGAKDDGKGTGSCAAGGGGADHVYRIQPTGSGQLSIKVQGEGAFNPTIYVRSTCTDEAAQAGCAPPIGAGKLVQLSPNVVSGREYFLFVDGGSGTAGKYTLTLKLTTGSFCGDGKVDPGEACDDGNKVEAPAVPTDGCSNSCQQVNGNPTSGGTCPGHPVDLWPGKTVIGTGSNKTYGNTFNKTNTLCTVNQAQTYPGNDHVYAVTPHKTGSLKVTLTRTDTTSNPMLVARTSCADPATQIATVGCANNYGSGENNAEVITVPVTDGKTIYVAADSVAANSGDYTIKFELP